MRALVTGTAGFIGFHVARRLLADGHIVTGIDGITRYYDISLKQRRHVILNQMPGFTGCELMLENLDGLAEAWHSANPEVVIHLAAQAGVRYSVERPRAYVDSNVLGTFHILELARASNLRHLLVSSTSSVYGANAAIPFQESDSADHPLSLYAATKKATEVIGHSYAHLFSIPTTFFRFFTVYGPWGRPDMAPFKFTKALFAGEPIDIYNQGEMRRDFTYIDDIVEAIVRLIDVVPMCNPSVLVEGDTLSLVAPFRIVNIGKGEPIHLLDFIDAIEGIVGRKFVRNYMPMQLGDVPVTFASADLLERLTGFRPATPVKEGIRRFVDWYIEYYRVR